MSGRLSRREFLGRSAAGLGAGLLFPHLTTRHVLGAPGDPAPSDKIRIGHIGVGSMGSGHLSRYAHNAAFPSVAVCDTDGGFRRRAQRAVGEDCPAYGDFRELLDRPDIDAVIIATPDHWHALVAVAACQAGKDIYCEKPLALTIRQGRAMANAVRRYRRVFQTGSQQRSSPEFRYACELVRSGRIGRVHTVYVGVGGPSAECYLPEEPCPPDLDWEAWLGPAPRRPFNSNIHPYRWRAYRDYSGGSMTDWGAHHMDIAQWGLGKDGSGPVEVEYSESTKRFTYRHREGTVVEMGNVPANGVRFIGTEGVIEVNRGYFRTWPDDIGREALGPGDELFRKPDGSDQTGHHENWQQCLRNRERPICDVEIGHRSITACHLGNIAYWLGRKIHWRPENEEIIGDKEASRWLDRPMRPPWHL